jgi:exopolyphosphatase/guanosine-5'-triphosphate,3'-diphosphate pyrophosphatase
MKIAFYISNHGFGHATRANSLIEYFLEFGITCYAITNRPEFLFTDNPNFILRKSVVDFGIKQDTWIYPNKRKTLTSLKNLINNKTQIIKDEVDFFKDKNISFIISDISFFAFDIAEKLKVPSLGISNFDWHYIYKNMLGSKIKHLLESIEKSYQKANFGIKLPFSDSESMAVFSPLYNSNLICRKPKKNKNDILNDFQIPENKKLVVVTFGGNQENPLNMENLSQSEDIIILSKERYYNFPNYRYIPDDYDFASLLFHADYIITKTGYSSLAESIQGGGFVIATDRSGFPEDKILIKEMKKYPNFLLLKPSEIYNFNWRYFFKKSKFSRFPINNYVDKTAVQIIQKIYMNEKNKYVIMDLGTNNLLILWAIKNGKNIKTVYRTSTVPSLGKDMKNGMLSQKSIEKTKSILEKYINFSYAFSENIIILGTSCSRDAKNIDIISSWLKNKFNIKLNIISEKTEAELNGLSVLNQYRKFKNIITFDVGGGSTEFTLIKNNKITDFQSLNLGLRRLENSFGNSLINKRIHTIKLLNNLTLLPQKNSEVIGIGGTTASVAAIIQNLKNYDKSKINGFIIYKKNIESVFHKLKNSSNNELLSILSFEPERIDLILSGIMVLLEIMNALNIDKFYVSDLGIQYGFLHLPINKIQNYLRK